MKIAISSTPLLDSPPQKYGGLELVAYLQAKGLAERGHKVVLFATDDSKAPPKGFLFKIGKALSTVNVNWMEAEDKMYQKIDPCLGDFDIVHSNDWFGFNYRSKYKNPQLKCTHTHHGHLSVDWWCKSPAPFKLNMVAISEHMRNLYETGYGGRTCKIPARVCYNGIDLHAYPLCKEKGDRLLFLGRIDPIKGVHTAIEVAEKAGTPIDIVGATEFVSNKEYVHEIRTRCSQSKYAKFIGEVSHGDKVKYLQEAKALVACSTFSEPFGLHFCEANACGTPVITSNDGAASEVIAHDETGFVCNSVDEMVDAVKKLETIDAERCRERVERLFSVETMATRLEILYRQVVSGDEW